MPRHRDGGGASRSRKAARRVMAAVLLAGAVFGAVWYVRCPAPPESLGVHGGRLAPCPSTPNCVSSFEEGERHVEPLEFGGPPDRALARLEGLLRDRDDASIIERTDVYLHAEFRTPVWGFVDDVEFLLDAGRGRVHVRSASRRGYSDLGTNRERVEAIRRAFRSADGGAGAP